MWFPNSAIRPVPAFARLPATVIATAPSHIAVAERGPAIESIKVDIHDYIAEQTEIAAWMTDRLVGIGDDVARSFGLAMSVIIWKAFSEHFSGRIGTVSRGACDVVSAMLEADEELRRRDSKTAVEYDDIVAAYQPEVVKYIRLALNHTLSKETRAVDVRAIDKMYRMMLVETLVLSYAVLPKDSENDAARYMS